jgi:hypothetical protein
MATRPVTRAWLASSLFALSACSDVLAFDIDEPLAEQRITGSPLPNVLDDLFPAPISIDLRQELAARETGPIDSIRLKSLELAITATGERADSSPDDWSFLERCELFVEATGLSRVSVAIAARPGPTRTLVFQPVEGVNLQPYVDLGAQMSARTQGTVPRDDVTFDGLAVFTVYPL